MPKNLRDVKTNRIEFFSPNANTLPVVPASTRQHIQAASFLFPANVASVAFKAEKSEPRKPCHCKKSKCLKLYCECFSGSLYCLSECKCVECRNLKKFDAVRKEAIDTIIERNPNAFKPKALRTCNIRGQFHSNSLRFLLTHNRARTQVPQRGNITRDVTARSLDVKKSIANAFRTIFHVVRIVSVITVRIR